MNTEKMLNRAYSHWLKDGLFEIGLGILFTGIGALRAIIHLVDRESTTYYWLLAGLVLFMIGFGWGSKRVGEVLKARITYPRTGFMAFKPRTYNYRSILAWLVLLIFAGVLGGVVGVLATQPNQQEIGGIVPIIQGIVCSIVFTYAAKRIKVKRLYYLAVFSLGVGVVLGLSFFYLSIGLAMMVSGCVALVIYLRSYEPVNLSREGR